MALPHDDDDADHEAAVRVNHHAVLIHDKQQMMDLQKNRQSFYFLDQITENGTQAPFLCQIQANSCRFSTNVSQN